jgi:hypothetical protein
MLKDFRDKGPWTYYHRYVKRGQPEVQPSEAMRLGSAFHLLMADGEDFASSIVVRPPTVNGEPINMRKKAHREHIAALEASSRGKIILAPEEVDQLLRMKDSVWDNPAASPFVSRLTPERSEVIALEEVNGLMCKGMCDADFSDEGVIIDFKTTRHHLGKQFARDALYKFGYHFQAAHYCDVFHAERFIFIAVRNFPPYESLVFEMPSHLISQAQLANHDTLERIRWCQAMSDWHTDGWGLTVNLEDMIDA